MFYTYKFDELLHKCTKDFISNECDLSRVIFLCVKQKQISGHPPGERFHV